MFKIFFPDDTELLPETILIYFKVDIYEHILIKL